MSTSNIKKAEQLKDMSFEELMELTIEEIQERKAIVLPTGSYLVSIGNISLPDPENGVDYLEANVTVQGIVELQEEERMEEANEALAALENQLSQRFYLGKGHGIVSFRTLFGRVIATVLGQGTQLGAAIAYFNENPGVHAAVLVITERKYIDKFQQEAVRNEWRALDADIGE